MRIDQVAAMTAGTLYNTDAACRTFRGVSIDSRTLVPGELFVAINGANHDGHEFIGDALGRGAAGILAELTYPRLAQIPGQAAVVAVPDSHQAMMTLARCYREQLRAAFVGITGSNGKTTTKEYTACLAAAVTGDVYRSPGNLNNLFGVPLAIFGIPADTKVAILELGISTMSEMPVLARMVRPQVAVFTNVGASHLENFGSIEKVAQAKLELARLADEDTALVVNADDPILLEQAEKIRTRLTTFAIDNRATFTPDQIDIRPGGARNVTIEGNTFRLALPGRHQVYNLLAAYAAVRSLGYSFNQIETEAVHLTSGGMRGQTVTHGRLTLVVDCYNANPVSMNAGLDAFEEMAASGRRILVLGDMLELGESEAALHRELGERLIDYDCDYIALIGPLSRHAYDVLKAQGFGADHVGHFASATEAARALSAQVQDDDLLYLKASRGIGLEAVVDSLRAAGGEI
ncbi:MAG: UDP-N-acetylmuramoyl-tripeptide--D-alanyl-D-alanine ligase [bacterium]